MTINDITREFETVISQLDSHDAFKIQNYLDLLRSANQDLHAIVREKDLEIAKLKEPPALPDLTRVPKEQIDKIIKDKISALQAELNEWQLLQVRVNIFKWFGDLFNPLS
jgi:hypothetical protein